MPRTPSNKSDFLRRLAYFTIGLAIGLVMLGFFQQARRAEMAREDAERAARDAGSSAPIRADPTKPDVAKPEGTP